jgi:DNA-binding winged helix-turn-helix (wHTH) protein/Tol biopolymer transport system component
LENVSQSQFGPFSIDVGERVLRRDGRPVPLTPKAFDVLAALVERPGRLISKEELLQKVWSDTFVEESNLAYNVFALRKALGDTAENGRYIETVAKRGYRFIATVTRASPGNTGSPSSEAAAEAPVPEAANGGKEFHPSGKLPPSAATSDVRRYSPGRSLRAAAWFAAGLICASGVVVLMIPRRAVPTPPIIRAQIAPGVQLSEASPFAVSPDGQQLVFAGSGSDGVTRLWVRRIDAEVARPLSGTEAALGGLIPPMFWSSDSQSVAFDAGGELKRIDVRGGAPRTVCPLPNGAIGGSWNANDVIVVGQAAGGLLRCPAAGGAASEATRLDAKNGESLHLLPSFLPDGRHFLYLSVSRTAPEKSGVYLGSLDEEPGGRRPDRLLPTGFGAAYVGSQGASTGHVVFLQDQTLFAQPFDERSLQLRGVPVSLAHPVGSFLDGGFFAVSQNDVIAFRAPDKEFQLTWFDRRGNKMGTVGEVGLYSAVALSPDDSQVATVKEMFRPNIDQDIWVFDSSRTTMGRVTSEAQLEGSPVWGADGKRVIFTTTGGIGSLFEQVIDRPSSPKPLLKTNEHLIPTSVSTDGRFLLYAVVNPGTTRLDIWVLSLTHPEERFPLVQREFDQWQGQFSRDGRWVAYVSNESGRSEVLVRRFAAQAPSDRRTAEPETVIVSSGGGTAPRWRADGKQLYFISADGTVMVADTNAGARISVGVPRALFQIPRSHGDWAVVADGSRFLIAMPAGPDTSAPFTMLWNRLAGLRAQSGS